MWKLREERKVTGFLVPGHPSLSKLCSSNNPILTPSVLNWLRKSQFQIEQCLVSLRRIFDPEVGRILWGFIWIKEVKLGFDNSLRPKNVSSLSIPPSPSRSLNWPRWRPSSLGWQWQPPLGQPGNGSKMVKAQLELELRKFEWLEQYGAYTLTISNSNFLSSAAWIHYRLT